jgi:hypothetical protein
VKSTWDLIIGEYGFGEIGSNTLVPRLNELQPYNWTLDKKEWFAKYTRHQLTTTNASKSAKKGNQFSLDESNHIVIGRFLLLRLFMRRLLFWVFIPISLIVTSCDSDRCLVGSRARGRTNTSPGQLALWTN